MNVVLTPQFEEDFRYWLKANKSTLTRIVKLVNVVKETPFSGIGKPEALKYELSGCWSRRIDGKHRLVYKVEDDNVILLACRLHYQS